MWLLRSTVSALVVLSRRTLVRIAQRLTIRFRLYSNSDQLVGYESGVGIGLGLWDGENGFASKAPRVPLGSDDVLGIASCW